MPSLTSIASYLYFYRAYSIVDLEMGALRSVGEYGQRLPRIW